MTESKRELEHGYTCQEIVSLASEYLEGAMTPEQMTEFELHLNFCDGCYRFVDQVRSTAAVARRLSEKDVPDDLKAELLDAFREWRRE